MATQRAAKAGRIWAVEPLGNRRELAREIGAHVVIEPGGAVEETLSETWQRGVNCAMDCAAGEHTPGQAIQLTCSAGGVALTGIHSIPLVSVDGSAMRRKRHCHEPFSDHPITSHGIQECPIRIWDFVSLRSEMPMRAEFCGGYVSAAECLGPGMPRRRSGAQVRGQARNTAGMKRHCHANRD